MATSLQGIHLSEEEISRILEVAKDFALTNGMVFKPQNTPENQVQCAPFALFPSVVPKKLMQQAIDTMVDFNRLMFLVAQNHTFLEQSLSSVVKVDPFVQGLWEVYSKVREEGFAQTISLDIFRNDFMMDYSPDGQTKDGVFPPSKLLKLKQIEFNTISASFAGLVGVTTNLHRLTLDLAGKFPSVSEIPENKPAKGIANGLIEAWKLYNTKKGVDCNKNFSTVILMVVSEIESNIIDQRWIEFTVHDLNPKIKFIRCTLPDINIRARLDENKVLFIDNMEVAVVYFRTGYSDESYPTDKEWTARLLLERSRAIKSPTIQSQLSGCKKIQQELARPGVLEQFISDAATVSRIRATFAGLYALNMDPEGNAAVFMGMASPEKYVLKPQREGGGHNFYGSFVKLMLEKFGSTPQREAYILMERINALPEKNYLVKAGLPCELSDVISELGIYGVYIGDGATEIQNYSCGHILRTKLVGTDEGGIVAGFSALDSPFVLDV